MIRKVVLLAAMFAMTGCGYNTIQTMDEAANSAQGNIEVQLQRRADLVPNLVEVVKGYAAHEDTIFTKIAEARANLAGAVQTHNPEKMAQANSELTGALGRLLVVVENYPNLKADAQFMKLQDELAGTENRIARARIDYTDAVKNYNGYIRRFPQAITAKITGAKARPYFEVTSAVMKEAPKVNMTGKSPAPADTKSGDAKGGDAKGGGGDAKGSDSKGGG